jgi:FAD synthase
VDARLPTANSDVRPELLVPQNGIYARSAETRAAVSIGTNPHYGAASAASRLLLDFEGDLYGRRLIVELGRSAGCQSFESEQALIDQIARDAERTRAARRP